MSWQIKMGYIKYHRYVWSGGGSSERLFCFSLKNEATKATWESHLDTWEHLQSETIPNIKVFLIGLHLQGVSCLYQNLSQYHDYLAVMYVSGILSSDRFS